MVCFQASRAIIPDEDQMETFLIDRMTSINEEYFDFTELPKIKWSKGVIKKKYRKLTFGTYDIKKEMIRIHPILKNPNIPSLVLDFIIYHELLHYEDREQLKTAKRVPLFLRRRGKNRVHNNHFHNREKAFPFKKEATKIMTELVKGKFNAKKYKMEYSGSLFPDME
jgi:hypothetical protein